MSETQKNYVVLNKEKINLDFEVGGEDIISIYDPPHLLKSIRNKLYTKNVNFTLNGTTYRLLWDHIMAMYELEKKIKNLYLKLL